MADYKQYVHEFVDDTGKRWWVVAEYRDGRYYAHMNPRSCRLTGCSTVFGPLNYVAGNAYCYRNMRDALRRARAEYGADWGQEEVGA